MKQKLLYIFCMFWCLIAFQSNYAQTLSTGDIAFIGYHTDSSDGFTFIALTDIPAGEVIYFTDKGWNTTSATWYANSEDHIIWIAPVGGISIGTVVSIIETSSDTFTTSQGTAVLSAADGGFSLLGGDSILAYQSSSGVEPANPTFIAGIYGDDNYLHTVGCDNASGWFDCSTCTHISGACVTSSGSTSGLPASLTNGVNALALFPFTGEEDNAKYTGILVGTVSDIRTAINNPANWNTSDSSINIASNQYSGISITPDVSCTMTASILAQTNVACNGGATGSLTVSPANGTAPYTYLWSNSATTASIVGVAAGTYNVTITDANGCTDTSSVTITEPAVLVASSVVDSNVSCNGGSEGSATASAAGGTAPYTYLWSNSATTASIVGVAAGIYNVTITDANGCTDTSSVTITEPAALDNSITQDSGVLTANQTGATYQWYACPDTLLVGETDLSFTPSEVGSYKVEITMGACVVESVCENVTVLGLGHVENKFKFSMYPNPSNLNVHITTNMDGYFQIINQLGQIIRTFKIGANIESTVYVGDLNDGFYFVKSVNSNFTQKLIVKK